MRVLITGTLFLIAGCATASMARVQVLKDDFRGTEINRLTGNVLDGGSVLGGNRVELNVQRFDQGRGTDPVYSLIVVYKGDDWVFIRSGQSVSLLIDGEAIRLSGAGSRNHRDVLSGGRVSEAAWYDCKPSLIKRIAQASTVRVRVDGSEFYIERYFGTENLKKFMDFYTSHVAAGDIS